MGGVVKKGGSPPPSSDLSLPFALIVSVCLFFTKLITRDQLFFCLSDTTFLIVDTKETKKKKKGRKKMHKSTERPGEADPNRFIDY